MTSSPANWIPTTQPREELELRLEKAGNRIQRAQVLLKLAARTFRSDFEKAWELLAEGLSIAEEFGDPHGLLEAHCTMADLLCYRGRYRDALQALQLAEEHLREDIAPTMERARIESVRGKILCSSGRFIEAAPFLISALNTFRQFGDVPGIVRVTSALAVAYTNVWMYEEAMSLFLDALSLIEEDPPSLLQAAMYNGIGGIHSALNDHKEATVYLRKAYQCYRRIGDTNGIAIALLNIGTAYEEQRLWEESLQAYTEALPIAHTGEPAMLATLLTNIGTIYEHTGQFDRALQYELQALDIVNAGEVAGRQYRVLRCLGRLYAKMGRTAEAEEYLIEGLRRSIEAQDVDAQYQFHGELAAYYNLIGNAEKAMRHTVQGENLIAENARADALGKVVRLMGQYELRRLRMQHDDLSARMVYLERENLRQAQELTAATLQAAHKQEILLRLKKTAEDSSSNDHAELASLIRSIVAAEVNAENDEGWSQFERGFSTLHPEFIAKLTLRFPGITPTELKIATLLKIGISTKEIADVLCISLHTANTHRRRLRRKLELPESTNLVSFLASI